MLRALLFLYLCLGTAQAITWSAPQETLRVEDGLAVVPLPTVSPMLLRRDDSEWSNTCGYRSGVEQTCGAGKLCGYNTPLYWWGCCDGTTSNNGLLVGTVDCNIRTSCLDRVSASKASFADSMVLKCTNPSEPFCAKKLFVPSGSNPQLTLFNCISTSGSPSFFYENAVTSTTSTSKATSLVEVSMPNPNVNIQSLSTPSSSSIPNPNVDIQSLSVKTTSTGLGPAETTMPLGVTPNHSSIASFDKVSKLRSLFAFQLCFFWACWAVFGF